MRPIAHSLPLLLIAAYSLQARSTGVVKWSVIDPSGGAGGCLGFSTQDRESRITAAVWDLKQGTSAGQLTAKTTGTNVSIGVLVPILFFSATETAACEGLGKRLAQFVTDKSPAPD